MTNNGNTPPLRDRIQQQSHTIARLQRHNRNLRRAIADALDLIVEALDQPHPHGLIGDARAVLADAQPQADVRI